MDFGVFGVDFHLTHFAWVSFVFGHVGFPKVASISVAAFEAFDFVAFEFVSELVLEDFLDG